MLLFAILVGLTLYGLAAPDPVTLRTTRGAIGAIRSMPARTRSTSPRSTRGATRPTRSGRPARSSNPTRSTRSPRTRSTPDRPTPTDPPRPASVIARVIRGGLDASDRAVRRRGEALAAIGEVRARSRARKAARDLEEAEDQAHAENERRDRAEQRARSSAAAQDIAEQYDPPSPPAPPATPNGAAVPDFRPIHTTELHTLDQARAEAVDAYGMADALRDALRELHAWTLSLPERYSAANDLYKSGQMNANVALIGENQLGGLWIDLVDLASRLDLFIEAIVAAQNHVKESDAQTGRVETAIPG